MQCTVQSADRTFFDGEAVMVVARSERGEFAVMEGHAPLLATLPSGPLRVQTAGGEQVFACFGGTLRVTEVADVAVLVEDAVPLEEISTALEGAPDARRQFLQSIAETYG